MSTEQFSQLALSFPGVIEHPHFDRTAFKVRDKRIFATLHEPSKTANLKLPLADQATFSSLEGNIVYQVPNKWGLQGWTTFELENIPEGLMLDALNTAYQDVLNSGKKKK